MAEVVETDNVEAVFRRAGRKYPWAEWFDGRVWKLERGVDFKVAPLSMAMTIYQRANREGGKARVRRDDAAGLLYFQYVSPAKSKRTTPKAAP